jgi:hypothetical protein
MVVMMMVVVRLLRGRMVVDMIMGMIVVVIVRVFRMIVLVPLGLSVRATHAVSLGPRAVEDKAKLAEMPQESALQAERGGAAKQLLAWWKGRRMRAAGPSGPCRREP